VLFRTHELAYGAGPDVPGTTFYGRLSVARGSLVVGAAEFALNLNVIALLEAPGVLSDVAEADDAVPLGSRYPLTILFVFVAGFRGQREYRKRAVVSGGFSFRVLAKKALQVDCVFVECHFVILRIQICPYLTRDTIRNATRECPAPKGKRRFLGRSSKKSRPAPGPKPCVFCAGDFLGKEPEKQSRVVPQGAGKAPSG
jgi:hypothetical protein